MKYTDEVRNHFRCAPAFTISDMKIFLGKKGISDSYLRLLVHKMLAKKEIYRITRGIYTFRNETQIVGFGFKPFYHGLQDALSLRNLWEQETNPVVITPRNIRSGIRDFEGANYVVRRISRRMFFGFEMMKYSDFWIPVAGVEKTLIDFIYFGEPLAAQALDGIRKKINRKILNGHLKRCPAWVKKGVLDALSMPK